MATKPPPPRNRPNPWQWVWYAFGGKLPDRCAEWVLHDVTCPTWVLRHLARSLTQLAPLCVVFLVLPGPKWIWLTSIALGLAVGLFYSLCYMGETAEHRAIKHGHPPGVARDTRALRRDMRRAGTRGLDSRRWWD